MNLDSFQESDVCDLGVGCGDQLFEADFAHNSWMNQKIECNQLVYVDLLDLGADRRITTEVLSRRFFIDNKILRLLRCGYSVESTAERLSLTCEEVCCVRSVYELPQSKMRDFRYVTSSNRTVSAYDPRYLRDVNHKVCLALSGSLKPPRKAILARDIRVSGEDIVRALAWFGNTGFLKVYEPSVAKLTYAEQQAILSIFRANHNEIAATRKALPMYSVAEITCALVRLHVHVRLEPYVLPALRQAIALAAAPSSTHAGPYFAPTRLELAMRFGLSDTMIGHILTSYGLDGYLGGAKHHNRIYKIDFNKAFVLDPSSSNWSETQYWFGFMWADAHVSRFHVRLKIRFADAQHLVKLEQYLGVKMRMKEEVTRLKDKEHHLVYMDICGVDLVERFRALGHSTGNRIKSMRFISMHELLRGSSDFWRGHFDGNGWLSIYTPSQRIPTVSLISPLESVREAFSSYVLENGIESKAQWRPCCAGDREVILQGPCTLGGKIHSNQRISYTGRHAVHLVDLLYGADALRYPSLERKASLAKQILTY